MKELEANVRGIEKDGLVWGASKFVAVCFVIKKLQINLVIEDEKISLDKLQEQIAEDEDHVQSTDIVCVKISDIRDLANIFLLFLGRHAKVVGCYCAPTLASTFYAII